MTKRGRQSMLGRIVFALCLTCAVTFNYTLLRAAGDDDSEENEKKARDLENNLAMKREKSPVIILKERLEALKPKPVLPTEKVLIRELNVVGSTIVAEKAIEKLKTLYTNKELSGKEMQEIVNKFNRAYSRHGYITSYAYVVPEKLTEGILQITVVEGKVGTITITGNKNFSTAILLKKLTLKEGDLLNFITLNRDIYRMNRQQDRKASLVLDPTQDGKFTNITVKVKDKSPLHLTLQADNYGAETILYQRYKVFLIHNNITGHDDSLTAKIEFSQAYAHEIYDLDYVIPLNNQWKFELYALPFKEEDYYYKDNKDTDFEKRARKFYFWFYQSLINEPDCEFVSSYGFTYFDIFWYKPYREYTVPAKQDMYRILKWDLSLNKGDRYGRWVISNDLQSGIPKMWGGALMKSDEASVVGAKGNYIKNLLTVSRRQKLAYGIDFVGKARWQMSSATLTGVNDFSAGGYCGVIDNRGFPRTQAPGDSGRALNLGFTFPAYLIPRTVNVPYSKTKLYDSLKLFTFYDWAQSILKSPKLATKAGDPNDKKITTLGSLGCGFTFNVPDRNLAIRMDFGWPVTHQVGIDGDHFHMFWSATQNF